MKKILPDATQFLSGGDEKNKKKRNIAIAAAVGSCMILIAAVGYNMSVQTTERQHEQVVYSSSNEALTDSVKGYVNIALSGNGEALSEEAAQELVAEITAGVLNSLPETMLQDDTTVENLRTLISEAVAEEIMAYNEDIMSSEGYVISTTLSKDMLYYIDNVVVPTVTAEMEMEYGDVEGLKESLAATSEEYNANKKEYDSIINNITNRLDSIATNGATEEDLVALRSDLAKLEVVLSQYKSSTAIEITSLETELLLAQENLKQYISELAQRTTYLEKFTTEEINNVKEIMIEQISQNSNLTTQEITELKNIIQNMDVENASSVDEIKRQLADAIANSSLQQSEALDTAVAGMNLVLDSLKTSIDDLQAQIYAQGQLTDAELAALKENLLSQIESDSALSEQERAQLADAIASLDNSVASNLDAVKEYLLSELGTTNTNINSAVNGLNADLSSIRNTIEANKATLDAKDADLQEQIYAQGQLTDAELDTLKNNLLAQLEADSELSEQERQQLADAIASLDNSVASDLDAVKEYLLSELGETNSNITSAINNLDADLASIRNTIEANKIALQSQIDALNSSLGSGNGSNVTIYDQITNIQQQLGGWSLETRSDGHLWAVMYDDTGAEIQAKKLTFAQ